MKLFKKYLFFYRMKLKYIQKNCKKKYLSKFWNTTFIKYFFYSQFLLHFHKGNFVSMKIESRFSCRDSKWKRPEKWFRESVRMNVCAYVKRASKNLKVCISGIIQPIRSKYPFLQYNS